MLLLKSVLHHICSGECELDGWQITCTHFDVSLLSGLALICSSLNGCEMGSGHSVALDGIFAK